MFNILDFTKDNLIAFRVEGKVEEKDYEKLNALLEKTQRDHDTLKLYIEIKELEGIEPMALWEDFKTYFKHVRKADKIAIVGYGDLMKGLSKLSNPFVSGEVKFFEEKEVHLAKQWVEI